MSSSVATSATAGMVRPMLASAEPSARLMLVCRRSARAARTAAHVSGNSTSSGDDDADHRRGAPAASTAGSIVGESSLARPTTATSETSRRAKLAQRRLRRRWRRVRLFVGRPLGGQEIVAMADRLDEHERAPQHERRDRREGELLVGIAGPGELVVKVGSTSESVAITINAASAVSRPRAGTLLAVAQAADDDAKADRAVADDHDGGEDRVARQRRSRRRPPASSRRSAPPRSRSRRGRGSGCRTARRRGAHHLGVVHRGEHGRDQGEARGACQQGPPGMAMPRPTRAIESKGTSEVQENMARLR